MRALVGEEKKGQEGGSTQSATGVRVAAYWEPEKPVGGEDSSWAPEPAPWRHVDRGYGKSQPCSPGISRLTLLTPSLSCSHQGTCLVGSHGISPQLSAVYTHR